MSRVRSLGVGLIAVVLAACGSDGPPDKPDGVEVSGKIQLPNGAPLTGGNLILRPADGLHGATGKIQSDGSFTLADSAGKNSVVPGKYLVYVTFTDPAHAKLKNAVNPMYQKSEDVDSDVTVDIQQSTKNLVIRLKQ